MKLYILEGHGLRKVQDLASTNIVGVYSSLEKAKEARRLVEGARRLVENDVYRLYDNYHILMVDLDEPSFLGSYVVDGEELG
jgi:uncharacterized membrane protein